MARTHASVMGAAAVAMVVVLVLATAPGADASALTNGAAASGDREAYVTLLYGEDQALGAYVLAQSLLESGTKRELLCLVTPDVSPHTGELLSASGWAVERVAAVDNPFPHAPARFHFVLTKLKVFSLTQFSKIVYLDLDILVAHNVDELFHCPGFCATMRHSDLFNSGVMSLVPSKTVYDEIMEQISQLGSYTGGDQGILNVYYGNLRAAAEFRPEDAPPASITPRTVTRLHAGYNGDIGIYVLSGGRWWNEQDLKIIHYTLGSSKPWQWYTFAWFPLNWVWYEARQRLPFYTETLLRGDAVLAALLPLLFAGWIARYLLTRWRTTTSNVREEAGLSLLSPMCADRANPDSLLLHPIGFVIGWAIVLLATWLTFASLPQEFAPLTGWLLFSEWMLCLCTSLFAVFLHACYQLGVACGNPSYGARAAAPHGETATAFALFVAMVCWVWLFPMHAMRVYGMKVAFPIYATVFFAWLAYFTHTCYRLPILWARYGAKHCATRSCEA